jgi:hypothetical protein
MRCVCAQLRNGRYSRTAIAAIVAQLPLPPPHPAAQEASIKAQEASIKTRHPLPQMQLAQPEQEHKMPETCIATRCSSTLVVQKYLFTGTKVRILTAAWQHPQSLSPPASGNTSNRGRGRGGDCGGGRGGYGGGHLAIPPSPIHLSSRQTPHRHTATARERDTHPNSA